MGQDWRKGKIEDLTNQTFGRLKVIGFDDVLLASLTTPSITTIHQPIEEMAECAVRILDEAVSEKVVPIQTVLPVELVEREST